MKWSGNAGIGVNADGRFYRNNNFSRATSAHNIACVNSPGSNWSNVIYQLCRFKSQCYISLLGCLFELLAIIYLKEAL